MNFSSDNAYGAAPEILDALLQANRATATPYGEDEITLRLENRARAIFACPEAKIFPVLTGTAANALALSTVSPPYGAIFCHAESHIHVDECAAPEFFSGGAKLVPLAGANGKITAAEVESALPLYRRGVHGAQPSAISITQLSERGTAYRADEIAALSRLARRENMALHMDGARFANAVAFLGCAPAEITWKAGVDVLSLGATKNGALGAEAVLFFRPERVRDFEYRRKRAGQLASKMRFVSAQLDAYLRDDFWLRSAQAANAKARHLATALQSIPHIALAGPVEGNEVFAEISSDLMRQLQDAGAQFYEWEQAADGKRVVRFVLSALTPDEEIARLIANVRK